MIFGIDIFIFIFLVLCLFLVALFEFINGFHDTANAVAPVIYTKSLEPRYAVLLSGIMNFFGVILGGIGVAMAIIHLLPLEAIGYQSSGFGIIVVISLLLSAIIWNFATWYFGLPASSSHSLIGGILGVSISMMFVPISGGVPVVPNWAKAKEVLESLLISPFIGFTLAIFVMYISYKFIKNKYYFSTPGEGENELENKPRPGLRALLIGASAWVSFAHGSNDGQKGVGLAVLILVILAPSLFAVNPNENMRTKLAYIVHIQRVVEKIDVNGLNESDKKVLVKAKNNLNILSDMANLYKEDLDTSKLRSKLLEFQTDIKKLSSLKSQNKNNTSVYATSVLNTKDQEIDNLNKLVNSSDFQENVSNISKMVDYAPKWVIFLISLSLGLGTMIGRKRIVVTIGEKIGKTKMNYAQATTSALMTAITITLASSFKLPVSTTHILSSSVAGSMFVGEKAGGVQPDTVKNIVMAWVLTLPATIAISGFLFFVLRFIFLG